MRMVSVSEGSSEDEAVPMLVAGLKGLKVIDVACGSGDAQTLAVTENGTWDSCSLWDPGGGGLLSWRPWLGPRATPAAAITCLLGGCARRCPWQKSRGYRTGTLCRTRLRAN